MITYSNSLDRVLNGFAERDLVESPRLSTFGRLLPSTNGSYVAEVAVRDWQLTAKSGRSIYC